MRRTAIAHVVFGVNLEEADVRMRFDDGTVVLGLQTDTAATRDFAGIGNKGRLGHEKPLWQARKEAGRAAPALHRVRLWASGCRVLSASTWRCTYPSEPV